MSFTCFSFSGLARLSILISYFYLLCRLIIFKGQMLEFVLTSIYIKNCIILSHFICNIFTCISFIKCRFFFFISDKTILPKTVWRQNRPRLQEHKKSSIARILLCKHVLSTRYFFRRYFSPYLINTALRMNFKKYKMFI